MKTFFTAVVLSCALFSYSMAFADPVEESVHFEVRGEGGTCGQRTGQRPLCDGVIFGLPPVTVTLKAVAGASNAMSGTAKILGQGGHDDQNASISINRTLEDGKAIYRLSAVCDPGESDIAHVLQPSVELETTSLSSIPMFKIPCAYHEGLGANAGYYTGHRNYIELRVK